MGSTALQHLALGLLASRTGNINVCYSVTLTLGAVFGDNSSRRLTISLSPFLPQGCAMWVNKQNNLAVSTVLIHRTQFK